MIKVCWGIIGCGDVTEVKSGPAFYKVDQSELTAVMRRDADKAADYALRHNVPNWYANADLLINDPKVNAIYIATPPNTHAFYAKKAIDAGKPVYIEKPMCKTYDECKEVINLGNEKKVPVFVAYYRRKLPGFVKVKELLDHHAIGELRMVDINLFKHFQFDEGAVPWRLNPEIAGGGHFYDLASHQFDLMYFLFGDIVKVNSIVKNQSNIYVVEDLLTVNFEFENGMVGSGNWCFNSAEVNNLDRIVIYGTKGRIEFSTFDFTPVHLITNEQSEKFEFSKPLHVQQPMIKHVVDCLLGKDVAISTGETAAKTNWILEEIVKEFYKE